MKKMPCYPRNAYCLDRGPPPKDSTLWQIFGDKETAIDNLLTESFEGNQDKTVTITEINKSTQQTYLGAPGVILWLHQMEEPSQDSSSNLGNAWKVLWNHNR